ncbi:hypothetical protein [Streptomyces sp. NPDC059479]|uniref:hypothetical protein n=1 Tax=Streptomyces sp. NPDC059479 TaxID=3346848 RepID=UPI0036906B07
MLPQGCTQRLGIRTLDGTAPAGWANRAGPRPGSDRLGNMTAHPRIGSIWVWRYPDAPQHDYDFRVTGVFTKDSVTYIESERLDSGALRRGRLDDILEYAEPVSTGCTETLHDVDTAAVRNPKPHDGTPC